MADNLQTKTEKLIKYGNEKFGLSETTLRGILDNVGTGGGSQPSTDEWQPNPTWWDIETILAEDTRDYAYKTIILLYANDVVEDTLAFNGVAYATSDGAFYELGSEGSVSHNWDLTKDKPCIVDGVEQYKTRYVIVYGNRSRPVKSNKKILYIVGDFQANDPNWFETNYSLQAVKGNLKISTGSNTGNNTFQNDYSLRYTPSIDTSEQIYFKSMYYSCYSLQNPKLIDTSKGTNFSDMHYNCQSMTTIPLYDTSNGKTFDSMCRGCISLLTFPSINTSNGTSFNNFLNGCKSLKTLRAIDTRKATNLSSIVYGCTSLETIELLDFRSCTLASLPFTDCKALKNLTLKNIKISLQIGSGSSWGHLLTLNSLLNTIKELHDNTSGSSTLTLTVGSANLTKLANVYVKLIDITDEMRAEDEFIDLKKPFEVCESTDAGAMLITEYVTSKHWQLA